MLKCGDEPYTVLAEANGDAAFVRVERGAALSLSNFDVGRHDRHEGDKGLSVRRRASGRPGDEIYLTLIVASTTRCRENHPASLEFYNPNGQLGAVGGQQRVPRTESIRSNYGRRPPPPRESGARKRPSAGATFEKNIRVDAVKPNRMKIEMRLGDGQTVDAKEFTGRG